MALRGKTRPPSRHASSSEGYQSARKALALGPDGIINEMKASNLRSAASGAGIPDRLSSGRLFPNNPPSPKYHVLVNGDESRPRHSGDRLIFEHDPHAVIEGTIIAGLSVQAKMGFIYLRGEYRYLLEIMERAFA